MPKSSHGISAHATMGAFWKCRKVTLESIDIFC